MKDSVREILRFEIDDQGRRGILALGPRRFGGLIQKKTFVRSLDEFKGTLPRLPELARKDPRYLDQLAYGLAVITFGGQGLIRCEDDIGSLYLEIFDDPEVLTRSRWRTNAVVTGPDPQLLCTPTWDGDHLVITTVSELSGMQGTFSSDRYEYCFDADKWTYQRSNIAEVSLSAEQADAAVRQAFGGGVDGFIRIAFDPVLRLSSGGAALLVGLNPSEGSSRFVWLSSDGEIRRFSTWFDFQEQSGAFQTGEAQAFLVGHLFSELTRLRVTHENYSIIEDPIVYREEYIRANRQIQKLRYRVDEMRITEFAVEDFDAIHAPIIEGTEVVAFFKNSSGQPNRLTFDLHELDWNMDLEMEPLFTAQVTSDTGGPPGVLNQNCS